MTLLDVWVSADKVLIGVDTAASVVNAKRDVRGAHASKLLVLAHVGMVFAARGNTFILQYAFYLAQRSLPCRCFDDFDDLVPELVARATAAFDKQLDAGGLAGLDVAGQELFIAGFSDRHNCMRAVSFHRKPGSEGFVREEVSGDVVIPWNVEKQGPCPVPNSIAAMEALARAQVAHVRAASTDPIDAHAYGGKLIVATVKRESILVQTCCDLG